jgi:hypothetical protein
MASVYPAKPRYYYKTEETTVNYTLDRDGVIQIAYQPATGGGAESEAFSPSWFLDATPPDGLSLVSNGLAFSLGGVPHFSRDGALFAGWNPVTGAAAAAGSVSSEGRVLLTTIVPGVSNTITWSNAAHDARGALDLLGGVFRVASAPIQAGQFQIQAGDEVGTANSGGVLSGDFEGLVDSVRGVVAWVVAGAGPGELDGTPVRADEITYNAVFLQYIPIDPVLLGVDPTGLPIDGLVPMVHVGGGALVHHTDVFELPDPVVKGTPYHVGEERISVAVLRDAVGTRLPGTLYTVDRNPGNVTVLEGADISTYALPLRAHWRIQDELQVTKADIDGTVLFSGSLTHNFPVPGSFLSSKLRQGDKFARVHGYADRATWAGSWTATKAGAGIAAAYNEVDFPITTTNRGAIKERWYAILQSNTTQVNVYGENVGLVLSNAPIADVIEAINPQTSVPYWSIPAAGWGGGRSAGNVLLWETEAAGGPVWFTRSVLPGAAAVLDDSATLAYISDVDTP